VIEPRPFASLGGADLGWLQARHHFSFGAYRDPARMGWSRLRVWNDDQIAPGTGFDPHPHRDMEIITYVREGAVSHRDNLGNSGRTEAGDVQVMSAGTGIVHSEYNLETTATMLFQIWLLPDILGARPSWGTRRFPLAARAAAFEVLASGRAADAGSPALPINVDGAVLAATLQAGQTLHQGLERGRAAYLVAAKGTVMVNGHRLGPRDGAAIAAEQALTITAEDAAELVLVEMAAT